MPVDSAARAAEKRGNTLSTALYNAFSAGHDYFLRSYSATDGLFAEGFRASCFCWFRVPDSE